MSGSGRLPSISQLTSADFGAKFQDHLPQGEIWSRELDTTQSQVVLALMNTYLRLAGRDGNLLVDAFPLTTSELLVEWEATLGLPDSCSPLNATFAQRLAAVAAKIAARGGQSVAYFINVTKALGFSITITEQAGSNINTWIVNAPAVTSSLFRVGLSTCGDPLQSWGNAQLECVLNKLKPAHTIVDFSYGGVMTGLVATGTVTFGLVITGSATLSSVRIAHGVVQMPSLTMTAAATVSTAPSVTQPAASPVGTTVSTTGQTLYDASGNGFALTAVPGQILLTPWIAGVGPGTPVVVSSSAHVVSMTVVGVSSTNPTGITQLNGSGATYTVAETNAPGNFVSNAPAPVTVAAPVVIGTNPYPSRGTPTLLIQDWTTFLTTSSNGSPTTFGNSLPPGSNRQLNAGTETEWYCDPTSTGPRQLQPVQYQRRQEHGHHGHAGCGLWQQSANP